MDTVGRNETAIKEYVKNQLEEDYTQDQITFKEYIDPFTGARIKRQKEQPLFSGCPK